MNVVQAELEPFEAGGHVRFFGPPGGRDFAAVFGYYWRRFLVFDDITVLTPRGESPSRISDHFPTLALGSDPG